jgi:RNA polymerase sigma-70 factor, ECF subfamily
MERGVGGGRHDSRSDEELVAAGNAGDDGALAGIYWRYREWAAAVAFRFTGDRDSAQDVVQEAFAYLFGKFPGFRLRAKLTTVLYPAVRNIALAQKRKKRPEAVGDGLKVVGGASAAPIVAEPAIGGMLAAALARLPEGQREVLLMRVVDEMSVAEIALALGIPEGTVKSRLHHAVAAMRGMGVDR